MSSSWCQISSATPSAPPASPAAGSSAATASCCPHSDARSQRGKASQATRNSGVPPARVERVGLRHRPRRRVGEEVAVAEGARRSAEGHRAGTPRCRRCFGSLGLAPDQRRRRLPPGRLGPREHAALPSHEQLRRGDELLPMVFINEHRGAAGLETRAHDARVLRVPPQNGNERGDAALPELLARLWVDEDDSEGLKNWR